MEHFHKRNENMNWNIEEVVQFCLADNKDLINFELLRQMESIY